MVDDAANCDPFKLLDGATISSLSGTNYDISLVVHALLHDEYVCGSVRRRMWYYFDGFRWATSEIGPYSELSKKVYSHYRTIMSNMAQHSAILSADMQCGGTEDLDVITSLQKDIVDIEKILVRLKNVTSKEALLRECCYTFYDSKFLGSLDSNPNLVCFSNGVYEITTKSFREGRKSDKISIYIDMPFLYEETNIDNVIPKFNIFRSKVLERRRLNHVRV
jgi:hypothetical protein